MRIQKIIVQNYRNLDEFEIILDKFNLIIGENNIGKSNLLNAINLVLNPLRYVRNFDVVQKDFQDITKPIIIQIKATELEQGITNELTEEYDPESNMVTIEFIAHWDKTYEEAKPEIHFIREDLETADKKKDCYPNQKKMFPFFLIPSIRTAKEALKYTRNSDFSKLISHYLPGLKNPIEVLKAEGLQEIEELYSRFESYSLETSQIEKLKDYYQNITNNDRNEVVEDLNILKSEIEVLITETNIVNGLKEDFNRLLTTIYESILIYLVRIENQRLITQLSQNYGKYNGFSQFNSDLASYIEELMPVEHISLHLDPLKGVKAFNSIDAIIDSFSILDHGTGHQSKFVIAFKILRIVSYLKGKRINSAIVGIEEPEAHLSPHFQRDLITVLKRLQNDIEERERIKLQFIITSHSSEILRKLNFNELRILKRKDNKLFTNYIKTKFPEELATELYNKLGGKKSNYERKVRKCISNIFQFFSEVFFSKVVILGEGGTEMGALQGFARKLNLDFDRYGISYLNIEGDGNINYYKEILNAINQRYLYILDKDKGRNISDPNAVITEKKAFEDEIFDSFNISTILSVLQRVVSDETQVKYVNAVKKFAPELADSIADYDDLINVAKENTLNPKVQTIIQKWLKNNKGLLPGYFAGTLCSDTEVPEVYKSLIEKAVGISKET